MKIIDRYIAWTLIKVNLLVLLSLVLLFSLFTLVDQLDITGRGDYSVLQAVTYVFLTMPRLSFELFPIVALIGSMTTLGMFARSGELAVLRTSGISQIRLAGSLCRGTVVLVCISLVLSELLTPYTESMAKKTRSLALSEQIALKTRYGLWFRDDHRFINIRKILHGDRVEGIYIYEFGDDNKLTTGTYAVRAVYQEDKWILEDVKQTEISDVGISVKHMDFADWEVTLDPEMIDLIVVKPKFLSFTNLYNHINYLQANSQNSVIYEQALWLKIINPLEILVMVLMAIPMIKSYSRTTSIWTRVFCGCLVGIVFRIINQTAGHMGIVYHLPPALSVMFPTLCVCGFMGWYLCKRHQ